MTWFGWFMVVWYILNVFLTVAYVGKRREPLSPSAAAFSVLISLALLVGVLYVGTGTLS